MAEKMRVHILAKELNVPSKVIVEKCKAEGINSVKNHMSTLNAGLHATIREWFSEGSHGTTIETAERVDLKKVRITRRRKKAAAPEPTKDEAAEKAPKKRATRKKTGAKDEEAETDSTAAVSAAVVEAPVAIAEAPTTVVEQPVPETEAAIAEVPALEQPAEAPAVTPAAADVPIGVEEVPVEIPEAPAEVEKPAAEAPQPEQKPAPITPAGPQNIPAKARLQGPRVVRYEAPDYRVTSPHRRPRGPQPEADTALSRVPEAGPPALEVGKPVDRVPGRRKGRASPRRSTGRVADTNQGRAEWGDRDLAERRERLAGATGRRIRHRFTHPTPSAAPHIPTGPKTEATVHEPVRMKEFCSETGLNFMQCFKVLKEEHGMIANINMMLPIETAELLALNFGIELNVIPAKTRLDELKEESDRRERKHLQPRPPVVTMLGHVDHGKTSLLDAIRKSHVMAREDGGITQHIGAYHATTPHGAVTFLDTPGHQAFTAIRARGAQLTDVVVLVVAADDGVMPQTLEAINHAKAAEVPIVVALNKIDLGEENRLRIYGQLTEQGLTPSGEWGGETDVIDTSATTAVGIRELVDHLAELSSLLELKADPTLRAVGTVIEAETKPGVGAVIRLLVQEGTLHIGDSVVCGPAFGKVRALLGDRGERIKDAGPSLPVEVWGLDDVPMAGDGFYAVENLQRAKDIAAETKQTRIERSRVQSRKVRTLEEMVLRRDSDEVPELNVIVKTDVDGSVTALQQALGEIPSEEVKLTFRHTGVGMVNDSDVLLAAACQGIIIGFRVETPATVRRLADQHGIDIRSYRVIYDVCDEVKKALEGLLAPEERIESRATVEVRQLFRLGKKIGMIAGSYVTNGVVDRGHFAKVVRDGVVVREGCRLASLRRFKDDVKEVRAGLECGIRLDGFDDVHVGDIVETYEIVKVARKL